MTAYMFVDVVDGGYRGCRRICRWRDDGGRVCVNSSAIRVSPVPVAESGMHVGLQRKRQKSITIKLLFLPVKIINVVWFEVFDLLLDRVLPVMCGSGESWWHCRGLPPPSGHFERKPLALSAVGLGRLVGENTEADCRGILSQKSRDLWAVPENKKNGCLSNLRFGWLEAGKRKQFTSQKYYKIPRKWRA